ncbi:hypothetical protein M422DRAFT_249854 [Sphaerobolus stellatus SS14]|uniref:Uncharacterized protein n=1 Tax=Sphaerobolus stellatus (strain SS14) TaxID=990650 RepID=A0A0C9UUG1_SPHS4|nr:hypothetical protein M422DRAFT_249854 [Sphaerobolus stellatus SS14]
MLGSKPWRTPIFNDLDSSTVSNLRFRDWCTNGVLGVDAVTRSQWISGISIFLIELGYEMRGFQQGSMSSLANSVFINSYTVFAILGFFASEEKLSAFIMVITV